MRDGDGKRVWGQGWQVATAERNGPGQSGRAPRLLPAKTGSGAMCDDASRANHQSGVRVTAEWNGCYLLQLAARPKRFGRKLRVPEKGILVLFFGLLAPFSGLINHPTCFSFTANPEDRESDMGKLLLFPLTALGKKQLRERQHH